MSLSAFRLNLCLCYSFLGSLMSARVGKSLEVSISIKPAVGSPHGAGRWGYPHWVPAIKIIAQCLCSCAGSGAGFLPQGT